jgi:hypothetical protein
MKFYVTVGLCANSDTPVFGRQEDGPFVIKVCGSEDMI